MKIFSLCILVSWIIRSSSFVIVKPTVGVRPLYMAQPELKPEPAEGVEIQPSASLTGSPIEGARMKNLGEAEGIKSEDGTVYKFWMKSVANEKLVKKYREELLKDAKTKADFPGFRKGVVPPFAMGQIYKFAIQEALTQSTENTIRAFSLKPLLTGDGQVEVKEELVDFSKGYKLGTNCEFTATLNAVFDPDAITPEGDDNDAITVEATPVEDTAEQTEKSEEESS
mmetsp:Transcript_18605/g.20733  ORF Transcript_18605/g.20733 Transcript_18605/m.20733 type:complete len:226 (-) Transcript_18605:136-813(-)